jgi:hypothetical protein
MADVPPVPHHLTDAYLATAKNRLAGAGDLLWEAARDQLREGTANGESHARLATRIRKATGLALPRARVIARTEARDALLAGSLNQVRATGLPGTKTWVAVRGKRTRPEHRHANGQTVDLAGYFTVGGWPMDRPHDEVAPAEAVVNCRCGLRFDLDTADVLLGPAPVRAKADDRLLKQVWDGGMVRKGVTVEQLADVLTDLGLTAALEAFHLPGKHNQQTHGHENAGTDLTPELRKHLPPEDAERVGRLLGVLSDRYGVGFDKVGPIPPSRIDQDIADTYGSKLRVNRRLLSDRVLAKAERQGWLAPGSGTVEGLITHEYAHRLLDDGSHGKASLATTAQTRARLRADAVGAPRPQAVSDYAKSNGAEVTAELFANYHFGGDRRAPWVVTWGETLHQELGVDPTPLSEVG